jgi:PAS domain-containing protein
MEDQNRSKEQLIKELAEMRQIIAVSDKSEAERRKAEESLRYSEEQFRTLVERNPHGVQTIDIFGTIIFANKAHHEIMGMRRELLSGGPLQIS